MGATAMNFRPLILVVAAAALSLTGCATGVSVESACAQTDWYATGVEDGARGQALTRFDHHRLACAAQDEAPDEAAYLLGRLEGLEQYCTLANGVEVGQTGGVYAGACPHGTEFYFLTGFRMGHEIHRLDRSIDQNRIEANRITAAVDKNGVDQASMRGRLAQLDLDYERLMERAAYLEAESQRVIVTEAYASVPFAD